MMVLDPSKQGSAYTTRRPSSGCVETVLNGICGRIISGEFQPGLKLPTEPQLQAEWGVSRAVVREAMKILESQGLVRIEQGRGTFVSEVNTEPLRQQIEWTLLRSVGVGTDTDGASDQWDHLMDIRRVLEVSAAERAAVHANATDIEVMRQSISDLRNHPEDTEICGQADLTFHRALAVATRNPLWMALLGSIYDLLHRYLELSHVDSENALLTANQHESILTAVQARDALGAAAAMEQHLATSREVLQFLRQQ
jgi:DNA-binding FadR family transcriptional regulator